MMTTKKAIVQIHLWLGLASGLVVLIISLTGCLYVFIEELRPLIYADRMYVPVPSNHKRLPLSILKEKAEMAIGRPYVLQNVEVPSQENGTYSFRTRKINKEAIWYGNYYEHHYRVYLNPFSGEIVKVENSKWEFFNLVVYTHVSLLLGEKVGGTIVGYGILMFVILLISGIVLWWPKNKSAAKQRVWFKWKEGTQWKRKNYDLHNILGFYAMLILLVISITGLVWSFNWVNDSVQWVANGGKSMEKKKPLFSDTTQLATVTPIDQILLASQKHTPEAKAYFINFPKDHKGTVSVFARDGQANYKSIRSQYDQHTGVLLKTEKFADLKGGEIMRSLNYDLHVGSVLGLPGKILAFLASLISASLPVTGFIVWWGKHHKNKKGKSKVPSKKAISHKRNPLHLRDKAQVSEA